MESEICRYCRLTVSIYRRKATLGLELHFGTIFWNHPTKSRWTGLIHWKNWIAQLVSIPSYWLMTTAENRSFLMNIVMIGETDLPTFIFIFMLIKIPYNAKYQGNVHVLRNLWPWSFPWMAGIWWLSSISTRVTQHVNVSQSVLSINLNRRDFLLNEILLNWEGQKAFPNACL